MKVYLAPDVMLRLFINRDCIDEMQMLMRQNLEIFSSNFAFYEAIACVEKKDDFNFEALMYVLKRVEFIKDEDIDIQYRMTPQRKEKLRKLALSGAR